MPAKPTKKLDSLITLASTMLALRYTKGEIKNRIRSEYFNLQIGAPADERERISPRTLERIIADAREELTAATNKNTDEHRNDAYTFYDSILRHEHATLEDKIRAQQAIDKLLGLPAPVKHELNGKLNHSGTVAMDFSQLNDQDLESLERIAEKVSAPAAVASSGPAVDSSGAGAAKT